MNNKEKVYDVNIENTNIIPIPEESRKVLNKKLIKEDPLTPYQKINKKNIIAFVIMFMLITITITVVIYKLVIEKWI